MLNKIVVVGGIVAIVGLGVGGAAWAESNSNAPQAGAAAAPAVSAAPAAAGLTAAASPTTAAQPGQAARAGRAARAGAAAKAGAARAGAATGKNGKRDEVVRRLEKVSHAQWVSMDEKTGTFLTHDAVRGGVSAVSARSITITAADGTSETFAVNTTTKVHVKGDAKGTAGTIAQVKVGDQVGVVGTGAGTMTATQVIDRGLPKVTSTSTSTSSTSTTAPTTS